MAKSILYRLFGIGKFPKTMVPTLQKEGIVFEDQGLSGSVIFRKFRAPGRRYSYRKSGFVGSLVITNLRFAAFAFSKPLVNLPLKKDKLDLLKLSVPKKNKFCMTFNAGDFHEGWKGTVECRFTTDFADIFFEKLKIHLSHA